MTPEERAARVVAAFHLGGCREVEREALTERIAAAIREAIEADRAARQCPDADVAAIRERCKLPTPGPWKSRDTIYGGAAEIISGTSHVASVYHIDPATPAAEHRQAQARLNAAFIAHARQDIPDLLSRVDDQAALIHDLSQDGCNADAYQRGLEIGRREGVQAERERAVRWARHHEVRMYQEEDRNFPSPDNIYYAGASAIASQIADDIEQQEGDPS